MPIINLKLLRSARLVSFDTPHSLTESISPENAKAMSMTFQLTGYTCSTSKFALLVSVPKNFLKAKHTFRAVL